jgi:purine-binding chemotaxis protein CheW
MSPVRQGGRFGWSQASARLEEIGRTLSGEGRRSHEDAERILRERARDLARPAPAPPPGELRELVAFSRGPERYAVDVERVAEVVALRGLVPLPGAPAGILGIVPHRGRLVAVADLRRLLGAEEAPLARSGRLVVVEAGEASLALLADGEVEVLQVSGRLAPPLGRERVEPVLEGLTEEAVAVVDVEALIADPRIASKPSRGDPGGEDR